MNVALVLRWPGNLGVLQAAIAVPLVAYGVPLPRAIAYGIALQAIESSVGYTLRDRVRLTGRALDRASPGHGRPRPGTI